MNNPKFQIFPGHDRLYYFRLKSRNGEVILSATEGYQTKTGCMNGIASVKTNVPYDKQYIRKTAINGREYYFILIAGNGEPIGKSEMYSTMQGRENGIEAVKRDAPGAPIEDLT